MKRLTTSIAAAASLALAGIAGAQPFANSLWIGNDTGNIIVQSQTDGTVLRTFPLGGFAVGFAVDPSTSTVYVNSNFGAATPHSTNDFSVTGANITLASIAEDFTWDNGIVYGDFGSGRIIRTNPVTNAHTTLFTVPFAPLGITTDGAGGFWISNFAGGANSVRHYDSAGTELFAFDPGHGNGGGLAYDPRDGTLYNGDFGSVRHFSTAGVLLGSFSTPNGNKFVDGLEFEQGIAAVPEPSSIALLLGCAVSGGVFVVRRRRK